MTVWLWVIVGVGAFLVLSVVITGNNTADPSVAGYPATTGWDPVTGLGTPNAANLKTAPSGAAGDR
jgi:hypothetical protein